MAYLDRLRSAEYIAPSGAVFVLGFDKLARTQGKKTAVHEFPLQDEANVQDLGNEAVQLSFDCYITGADYDQTADAFFDALGERGPGTLKHPRWGDLTVVPLTVAQSEGFVEGMGRAEFTIAFIVVKEAVGFPTTSVDLGEAATVALTEADAASSEAYAAGFAPTTAAELVTAREEVLAETAEAASWGKGIVADSAELATAFDKAVRELEDNIDALMADPVALAEAFTRVMRLPGTAVGSIKAKVTGYAGLITNALAWIPNTGSLESLKAMLLAASAAGAIGSTTTGTLRSRNEAVFVADTLGQLYRDALGGLESVNADPTTLAQLADAASKAGRSLLERSYTLASERRLVLPVARVPLELVAEFYGGIDRLDEFIEANELAGNELILVPAGREVVYYG